MNFLEIPQTGGPFARPANTAAYADGDLVSTSATASECEPIEFASQIGARAMLLRGVRLRKSTATTTNASFTLHLFDDNPGDPSNGDNGALTFASVADKIAEVSLDLTSAIAGSSTFAYADALISSPTILPPAVPYYGWLAAAAAYAPGSAETFEASLLVEI